MSAYLSRLNEIENLETPRRVSVESVETHQKQTFDTLDTAPPGRSQNFMVAAPDNTPMREWRVVLPTGECFTASCTPPATLSEMKHWYPGARIEPEPDASLEAIEGDAA